MVQADVGTTNSSQLRAVSDWGNHPAWVEFQRRYDPFLGRCSAHLRLQGADLEEVRQETWIAVARRMQSFVYDPRGTFRGWLWRVCRHEGMDLLKRRKSERGFSWDERDAAARAERGPGQSERASG